MRDLIESRQERLYRQLADSLGLGGDADKAFAHLVKPKMPLSALSFDKFEEYINKTLAPEQKEALLAQARPYFEQASPTQYEDANLHVMMNLIFAQTYPAYTSRGALVASKPYLATLPSGNVNAGILVEPSTNSPIIFFERGILQLIYDFSLLIGWSVPPISLDELRIDRAAGNYRGPYTMPSFASEAFSGSLHSYVTSGTPPMGQSPIPKPDHNYAVSVFLLGQMRNFVMAHELAHLTLDHLNHKPANITEAWNQEYEADALALIVLTESAQRAGEGWGAIFWASDLALACLDFLYKAISLLAFGASTRWINKTHPDATSRRYRLRKILEVAYASTRPWAPVARALDGAAALYAKAVERISGSESIDHGDENSFHPTPPNRQDRQRVGKNAQEFARFVTRGGRAAAGELCGMTDALVGRLWDMTWPLLLVQYHKGDRPSPIWKIHIANSYSRTGE